MPQASIAVLNIFVVNWKVLRPKVERGKPQSANSINNQGPQHVQDKPNTGINEGVTKRRI